MIINFNKIKKLPVVTESGVDLGKIVDINFLAETQSVYQYIVRPFFLSGRIFLIRTNQVVEISDKKIVVVDAVVSDKDAFEKNTNLNEKKFLEGVAISNLNNK